MTQRLPYRYGTVTVVVLDPDPVPDRPDRRVTVTGTGLKLNNDIVMIESSHCCCRTYTYIDCRIDVRSILESGLVHPNSCVSMTTVARRVDVKRHGAAAGPSMADFLMHRTG